MEFHKLWEKLTPDEQLILAQTFISITISKHPLPWKIENDERVLDANGVVVYEGEKGYKHADVKDLENIIKHAKVYGAGEKSWNMQQDWLAG